MHAYIFSIYVISPSFSCSG